MAGFRHLVLSLTIALLFSAFSAMAEEQHLAQENPKEQKEDIAASSAEAHSEGTAPKMKIIIRVKSPSKYQKKEEEKESKYSEAKTEADTAASETLRKETNKKNESMKVSESDGVLPSKEGSVSINETSKETPLNREVLVSAEPEQPISATGSNTGAEVPVSPYTKQEGRDGDETIQTPLRGGMPSPYLKGDDRGQKQAAREQAAAGLPAKGPEVSLTSYGRKLGDVLLELGGALRYTVIFGPQVDPNLPVVVDLKGVSLTQALSAITEYLNYGYVLEGRKIIILKIASRIFSLPDIAITTPTMSADIGGDMLGTSGGGSTGSAYGSVAGGADSASQNLKASVLLKKAADHIDGRKAFEENIRKLLSPDGHYVLDWNAATLMVHDSPRNVSLIERYIGELRASADKVLIVEATITQVSTSSDRRFGIDWTLLAERIGGEVLSSGSKSLSFTTTVTDIANPSLTVTRTAGDVSAVLKALEEQGKVNVLSKPFIYARNLQPVAIFEGKSIPYIGSVQKTTTGTIGESTTSYSISRAQDGVMLAVRCHIRDDGKVDIQIAPILATVDEYVTFSLGGDTFTQPVSSVQQTLQSVTLEDGEIVVIGGIKRDKKELSSRAVPLVSRIPLLGELFKSDNDTGSSSELVIALKARRVRG